MHYWHAPTIPAGTPPTTTVLVQSQCGIRLNLPAREVQAWAAKGNVADPSSACPGCVRSAS